jgi:hypothetical protein
MMKNVRLHTCLSRTWPLMPSSHRGIWLPWWARDRWVLRWLCWDHWRHQTEALQCHPSRSTEAGNTSSKGHTRHPKTAEPIYWNLKRIPAQTKEGQGGPGIQGLPTTLRIHAEEAGEGYYEGTGACQGPGH